MGALLAGAVAWLTANGPALISLGTDLLPMVSYLRQSADALFGSGSIDQSTFDAIDAQLKPFEDDLDAKAAAAQARVDSGTSTG